MIQAPTEKTKLISQTSSEPDSGIFLSCSYFLIAPLDLWYIFGITFFHSFSSFAFIATSSIYFTEIQGLSDIALTLLFVLTCLFCILFSLLVGNIGDRYGVRLTLVTGTFLQSVHYLLLIIVENAYLQIAGLLCFGCMGSALICPCLLAGIKRFSLEKYRSIAISCFWCMFYLGGLSAGFLLQVFHIYFDKTEGHFRILFIVLFWLATAAFILSLYLNDNQPPSMLTIIERQISPRNSGWKHTVDLLLHKRIWRLIGVLWLLGIIMSGIFQKFFALRMYVDREIGDDAYFGFMIMLNQSVIIGLLPVLAFTAYYCTDYNSFIIVGFISVFSPLSFVLASNYASVSTFITVSSIGEGILAFRIARYILKIAPEGKEAVVAAISTVFLVFSVIFSALVGGILMNSYCPESGGNDCWKVWGIISLIALPPTLLLLLLSYWIEDRETEITPYMLFCDQVHNED